MKLNEHEQSFDLHPVGVKYICEFCNDGEMIIDNTEPIQVLMTNPPIYPTTRKHICNKCGKVMMLPKTYPYVEWLTDEEYQKYEKDHGFDTYVKNMNNDVERRRIKNGSD